MLLVDLLVLVQRYSVVVDIHEDARFEGLRGREGPLRQVRDMCTVSEQVWSSS